MTTEPLRRQMQALAQQGRWEQVADIGTQLLAEYPDDASVHSDLSVAFFALGMLEKSWEHCSIALRLEPSHPDALANLKMLCRATGSNVTAALERIRGRAVADWSPLEVLACAEKMLKEGNGRGAFRLLVQFQRARPDAGLGEFIRERLREVPVRLTVVMTEGIGNMVMLTPTLRALTELFPEARIEVVGQRPATTVIEGWEVIDRCTELCAFDPSADRDALLLTVWSAQFKEAFPSFLEDAAVPVLEVCLADVRRHESEYHLDLARRLGFKGQAPQPYCRQEAVEWPFESGRPVVLLADTCNPSPLWQKKRWPHFRQLAARLLEKGYQVGLVGGPAEARRFEGEKWPAGVVNLLGRYTIPQTAYLIRRAGLLVANDSGLAHIGGAVGARTLVLFGPTRESKNLPLGPRVQALATDLGCRPCQYLPSWQRCTHPKCLERLTVGQVLAALEGEKAEGKAAPPPEIRKAEPSEDHLVKVDLGCGRFKRRGFIGIDIDPGSGADIVCDVTKGIPLESDSVDYLVADNLLEHLSDGFLEVMNEIWRVCKAGSRVEITVPAFPSEDAVADPTHRRWFTEASFGYFDVGSPKWRQYGASYGIKPFRVLAMHRHAGELEVLLTPVKDCLPQECRLVSSGEKPRVCFISHNQPMAGGGERAMHRVANGLAEKGYQVTVLYNRIPFIHARPVEPPTDARYQIEWVEGRDEEAFRSAVVALVASGGVEADVYLPLWRAASPGLLEAAQARAALAGVWCQNVQYPADERSRAVFAEAEFIVAVTPYARLLLGERFGRQHEIYVIPNAADDAFFEAYCERRRERIERLVFVGRLDERQKGLTTLCRAMELLVREGVEVSLDIIGDGPDLELLRSEIGCRALGERVRLLGWMGTEELARALPGYDLCVMPSNFEGCSLAIAECMAAGVPVVSTTAGGTPYMLVNGKHGLLVPPGQPEELAAAVRWACEHPEQMDLMARWARKRALKRFHWQCVVEQFDRLLREVYADRRARRRRPQAG